jgi:hypothetical protein
MRQIAGTQYEILNKKMNTFYWPKLPTALCILSMLFPIASSAGATSPTVGAVIERARSQGASQRFASVEGAIDKVWVEYGVKANGTVGLKVHTKFSVKKAANIECVVLAIIVRADGRPLKDGGSAYSTSDGRVAVHKAFTPPYDPANFPDTKFFIPYFALSLMEDNPNKMKVTVTLLNEGKEFARFTKDFGLAMGKVTYK